MDESTSTEVCRNIVERIFVIDNITTGNQKDGFLMRYRGHLRMEDSAQAYSQLIEQLRPFNITPLFRKEDEREMILLIEGVQNPKDSNPFINLFLFILTLLSVLLIGAMYGTEQPFRGEILPSIVSVFINGWPFAVSMLAILAAHEFGHYFMGRYYGIHVTLPYLFRCLSVLLEPWALLII